MKRTLRDGSPISNLGPGLHGFVPSGDASVDHILLECAERRIKSDIDYSHSKYNERIETDEHTSSYGFVVFSSREERTW